MLVKKKYIGELELDICKGLLQTLAADQKLSLEIIETNTGGLGLEVIDVLKTKVST